MLPDDLETALVAEVEATMMHRLTILHLHTLHAHKQDQRVQTKQGRIEQGTTQTRGDPASGAVQRLELQQAMHSAIEMRRRHVCRIGNVKEDMEAEVPSGPHHHGIP